MIEVACVCVGDKFPIDPCIDQLWLGLNKHLSQPFRLTVLTDKPNHEYFSNRPIRAIQIPHWHEKDDNGYPHWWYKIYLFSPNMNWKGKVLYLDLDVVLVNSIDKFTSYGDGGFSILQDFNRKWIKNYHVSNSSIMGWQPEQYYGVWEEFNTDKRKYMSRFRGDQDFITHYFRERRDKHWWPAQWAQSFKWEIFRGGLIQSGTGLASDGTWPAPPEYYHEPEQPWSINPDCSIVVFHGKPDPWQTDFGIQHKL